MDHSCSSLRVWSVQWSSLHIFELILAIPDKLINKRGTTWRKLSEEEQQNLDPKSALALIQRETSIIKRPIIHSGDQWLIGYDEGALACLNNP